MIRAPRSEEEVRSLMRRYGPVSALLAFDRAERNRWVEREIERIQCAPPPMGAGMRLQSTFSGVKTPVQIFGANLTLWLRASAGLHFTGPNLSQIDDQSGSPGPRNFQPFGGAVGPVAGAGINGHTTLDFTDTVDSRFVPINPLLFDPDLLGAGANNWTIFYVWKYTGANTTDPTPTPIYPTILGTSASPSRLSVGAGQDSAVPANSQAEVVLFDTAIAGWDGIITPASSSKANPHYTIEVFSGGNLISLFQDGAAQGTVGVTTHFNMTTQAPTIWGNYTTAGQRWNGSFGELGCVNVAASGAQLSALGAWLHSQWGI